jgi:hypothetical protein
MTRDLFGQAAPDDAIRIIDGACFDLVLHAETDKAILVSADGREANAAWLPKSRIEIFRGDLATRGTRKSGQIVRLQVIRVTVPEGLAKEKGLI